MAPNVRSGLGALTSAVSWVLVLVWVLPPSELRAAPVVKVAVAIAIAGLNIWIAAPGATRRHVGGYFFGIIALKSVVDYGGMVGLHELWQRCLTGLLLSAPFLYIAFNSGRSVIGAWWCQRRRRRS